MSNRNTFFEFITDKNSAALSCKKKEIIYLFDTYPKGIYLLTKGRIKTYRTNNNGKEFITEIHKAGDFFGYPVLLDLEKYTDAAMALEDSKIYFIPKEDFITLIESDSLVALKLIKSLAEKLNRKEDQLLKLAYNSVRKRVADALLSLAHNLKRESNNIGATAIKINRDELANLVGAENETTIRSLKELKLNGLINIKKGAINILNYNALSTLKR